MASSEKKARTCFTTEEEEVLLELVESSSHVLNNHKTNGGTAQMKKEHWEKIHEQFNSRTTNGGKSKDQLVNKFKNLKKDCKKNLAHNAREIKKTGGGPADLKSANNFFNFSQQQVSGLNNPYDSDSIAVYTSGMNEGLDCGGNFQQQIELVDVNGTINDNVTVPVEGGGDAIVTAIFATPKAGSTMINHFTKRCSKSSKTPQTEEANEFVELRKRKLEYEIEALRVQTSTQADDAKELAELQKMKLKCEIANMQSQVEMRKLKMMWYRKDLGMPEPELE